MAKVEEIIEKVGGLAAKAPGANQVKNTVGNLVAKTPEPVKGALWRYAPRAHRALIDVTGGKVGAAFAGMPLVELHTTGRKSGLERTTLLAAPIHDDDRVVLVASKGGADRHPEWFLNLQADPDVRVVVEGKAREVRARVASDAEKAELWPRIVATFKGYGSYQQKTDRDIPVIICEQRP